MQWLLEMLLGVAKYSFEHSGTVIIQVSQLRLNHPDTCDEQNGSAFPVWDVLAMLILYLFGGGGEMSVLNNNSPNLFEFLFLTERKGEKNLCVCDEQNASLWARSCTFVCTSFSSPWMQKHRAILPWGGFFQTQSHSLSACTTEGLAQNHLN